VNVFWRSSLTSFQLFSCSSLFFMIEHMDSLVVNFAWTNLCIVATCYHVPT
jgi:hypothetical protein